MKLNPPISVGHFCLACVVILFSLLGVSAFHKALPPRSISTIVQPNRPGNLDPGITDDADFNNFVTQVRNGQAGIPRGVYVPGVLALPIVQQPDWNPIYVSNKLGFITQFHSAAVNGVTGLLAHNYLSGKLFNQLTVDQEILVVYGDSTIKYYRISGIHRLQKLAPSNTQSEYLDLSDGISMTSSQVFTEYYQGKDHVTFQTCIKERDIWNWGLLFVVAEPIVNRN
jgi:hypothetical protein